MASPALSRWHAVVPRWTPLAAHLVSAALVSAAGAAEAASLRFHGNGVSDIDRVKVRIDEPANSLPGPPADVGASDFTIELWLRCAPGNDAGPVACGDNIDWIYGNIVVDRDRYNQDRKWGLSLAAGGPVWGVTGPGGASTTICGAMDLRDGAWHHVAVQRRRSDGWMWIFVDGSEAASGDGPDGDVSYPDDGVPGDYCGGPCANSDPFLVFGAEKHDAGPSYPSFRGWLDEIRISSTLRYTGAYTPPAAPFAPDAATAALYHLDEAAGDVIGDASGAVGGPSPGERRYGGTPAGPEWSSETFPGGVAAVPAPAAPAVRLTAAPNPFSRRVTVVAPATAGAHARLLVVDVAGRRAAELSGQATGSGIRFEWTPDERMPRGVYRAVLRAPGWSGATTLILR